MKRDTMKYKNFISAILVLSISLDVSLAKSSMFCNGGEDCLDGGSCQNFICQCKSGFIYNNDYTKCLKIPNSPTYQCEDTRQCLSILTGDVECQLSNVGGFCTCKSGFRRKGTACVSKIKVGQSCKKTDDCNDEFYGQNSMECKNEICTCKVGFYERKGVDCRPMSKEGEFCILGTDCPETTFCNATSLACEKKSESKFLDSKNPIQILEEKVQKISLELEEACSTTVTCKTENSFCALAYGKCLCMDGYTFNGKNCAPQIGNTCSEACAKNSECVNGVCQCKKYFLNGPLNEKCHKPARRLDESCTHDYNCYTLGEYAFCNNYKCQCRPGFKFDQLQYVCFEEQSGSTSLCFSDFDCSSTVNSHCDLTNRKCVCNQGYHMKNDRCYANLGSKCDRSECDGDHIICSQTMNNCVCEDTFVVDGGTCIKEVTSIEEECQKDLQCDGLLQNHGQCANHKCQCRPEYLYSNKTGKPECLIKKFMGDMCRTPEDCKVVLKGDNVVCRNSLCQCDYGFRPSLDRTECTSGATRNIISLVSIVLTFLMAARL